MNPGGPTNVSLEDIKIAADRIRTYIHRTPIATCQTLDDLASTQGRKVKLVMKCENLQKIGAFKIRGATNAVLSLLASHPNRPASDLTVITHSSGNHAQALAYAARTLGVACHVVMPSNAPAVKKAAVRGYGAAVTECTPTLAAREEGVRALMEQAAAAGGEMVLVPPYDDVRIVAGQGTLALELIEQAAEAGRPLDVLIAPVGGGGMLSGCALAAKGVDPNICVVGAEPVGADDAYRSFYGGQFVPSVEPDTVADGLRTSLGDITFPLIQQHVDAICTVSDLQIIRAMKLVYERMKLVIEPSAAVGVAVALYCEGFHRKLGDWATARNAECLNIGIVFSGGNVDLKELSALFEAHDIGEN